MSPRVRVKYDKGTPRLSKKYSKVDDLITCSQISPSIIEQLLYTFF